MGNFEAALTGSVTQQWMPGNGYWTKKHRYWKPAQFLEARNKRELIAGYFKVKIRSSQ